MEDDELFTSIPKSVHRLTVSLFVMPSSLASSVMRIFFAGKVYASVFSTSLPDHSSAVVTDPSTA
jgi:hypothetical protein